MGILEEITKIIKLMRPEFMVGFVKRFAKITAKAYKVSREDLAAIREKLSNNREKMDSPHLLREFMVATGYTQETKRLKSIERAIKVAEKKADSPLHVRPRATVDKEDGTRYRIVVEGMPKMELFLEMGLNKQCLSRLNDEN